MHESAVVSQEKHFDFEETFQNELVYLLIHDREMFLQNHAVIRPDYFTNINNVYIVKNLSVYQNKFGMLPTLSQLRNMLDKFNQDSEISEYTRQVDIVAKALPINPEFIKDQTLQFCKRQEYINALNLGIDLIEKNKFDEIKSKFDSAHQIGEMSDTGYDYFDEGNVVDRCTKDIRRVIPTLFRGLDKCMKGGLGRGELGLIIAPPKKGKTTLKVNLAANAMLKGKFVVYITLEMDDAAIAKKFDSRFSGLSDFKDREHLDFLNSSMETVSNSGGKLYIRRYPSGTLTCERLRRDLKYTELKVGRKIDMLVIDYLGIMRTRGGEISTDAWSTLAVDMRGIAQEFDIPVWSSIQTNRLGNDIQTIGLTEISKSYEIGGIVDFAVSLNQTAQEEELNSARLYIVLNRNGVTHTTIPLDVNRDICLLTEGKESNIIEEDNSNPRQKGVTKMLENQKKITEKYG